MEAALTGHEAVATVNDAAKGTGKGADNEAEEGELEG
jgi:hypothetical protein